MNASLLRGAIAEAGHTQESAAKAAGISRSAFNAKINGHRSFDVDEALALCTALEINDLEKRAKIFLS